MTAIRCRTPPAVPEQLADTGRVVAYTEVGVFQHDLHSLSGEHCIVTFVEFDKRDIYLTPVTTTCRTGSGGGLPP